MNTTGKLPGKHTRVTRSALICLVIAAAMLIGCALLYLTDGTSGEVSALNGQLATLTSATEQLDTLEGRYQKRVTQLAEAKANLAADPENEKLISKLGRAQGEYDKALKNRDNQLSKVEAVPTMEELNVQITALKESSATRSLIANLLLVGMVIAVASAAALMIRTIDLPVLISMGGLLIGGVLLVIGVHLNNLSPVLSAGQTAPGATLIAAAMGVIALCPVLFWCFVTRAKVDLKLVLGVVLILGGAGLFIAGFLDNNAPDAASRYINSMSPGFPNILVGAVLLMIGTVILAHPLTKIRYDIRKNPMLVIMVLPSIVYFLITSYLPMVGVYFAFTSYQFTTDFFSTLFGSKFVGLSNFEYLFSSGLAWRMTANTLIYNFIFIVGGTFLKVAIAIMFSEIAGKFYKKCVQTITFLPHFISMVMVGTFAYNLLNYNSGVINSLLVALGFDRMDFYSMPNAWYVILPLADFWKGVGYGSIIYVSAITGISDELYEAADLDGASFMQEIVHATIPSIRPTIVILTLMSLDSIMKGNFDLFYQLVGESGQLMETTEIIDTYVWRSLRQNVQRYGLGGRPVPELCGYDPRGAGEYHRQEDRARLRDFLRRRIVYGNAKKAQPGLPHLQHRQQGAAGAVCPGVPAALCADDRRLLHRQWRSYPRGLLALSQEMVYHGDVIYCIPTAYVNYTSTGVQYRKDLCDKYNLPAPDSIENAYLYQKGINENCPEMYANLDGGTRSWEIMRLDNMFLHYEESVGMMIGSVKEEGETPSWAKIEKYISRDNPWFRQELETAKAWADAGFWDRNLSSNPSDDVGGYFNEGMVALSYNGLNIDKYSGTVGAVHKDHPDWVVGFVPYGLKQGYVFYSSPTQDATAIPLTSENTELALKVMELVYTNEELMHLIPYGIEGVHYTVDENGAYVAADASSNFGQYAMNTWAWKRTDFFLESATTEEGKVVEEVRALMDAAPPIMPTSFTFDRTPVEAKVAAVEQVISQYLTPLRYGLTNDLDADLETFFQKAEAAGLNEVQDEYIRQYTEYCEQNGVK